MTDLHQMPFYFNLGTVANNPLTSIGMSDTSSNSSQALISSSAGASAISPLAPERNQQCNVGKESDKITQSSQYVEEETPPLLPRGASHQAGPSRPLPASPNHQQSQR